MKILFLTEYFYPFVHGGAEVSVYSLAKALALKSQEVYVLTPNFGAPSYEEINGVKIYRFWFPKKFKVKSNQLTPFWFTNPLYYLYLTLICLCLGLKLKIDIFHAQSRFSIPSTITAGWILKRPSVVTFRDNQILCNYGDCLSGNKFTRACDLKDYFTKDFVAYYKDKVKNKNFFTLTFQILLALNGRIQRNISLFFARRADTSVTNSHSQKKLFGTNGFKSLASVFNIVEFPQKLVSKQCQNIIAYQGKISSGKGVEILLKAFLIFLKEHPSYKLILAGSGDIDRFKKLSEELGISSHVKFLGRLEKNELNELYQKAKLLVMPSIYPESFGRGAVEAITFGTPVVVSNRGGLVDIVKDGITGYIVNPDPESLARAVIKGIVNQVKLQNNIKKNYKNLRYSFQEKPVLDYINLYEKLKISP